MISIIKYIMENTGCLVLSILFLFLILIVEETWNLKCDSYSSVFVLLVKPKMSTEAQVVEHFFGVYLLYCKNPKYKGRTYIGYTVNPNRRIKQHNAGQKFGGAYRTSNRGPWVMVLTVHGFPNSTSALRFEWAWQHPDRSRRLRHVPKKKASQKTIDYNLLVLKVMLQVGPWNRLPLTLRWLDDEFGQSKSSLVRPPSHMPIAFGGVVSKKPEAAAGKEDRERFDEEEEDAITCSICADELCSEDKVTCVGYGCKLVAHLDCLARLFTKDDGMILPIEGTCPVCESFVLWGDLIRKKIGCNMHFDGEDEDEDSSD